MNTPPPKKNLQYGLTLLGVCKKILQESIPNNDNKIWYTITIIFLLNYKWIIKIYALRKQPYFHSINIKHNKFWLPDMLYRSNPIEIQCNDYASCHSVFITRICAQRLAQRNKSSALRKLHCEVTATENPGKKKITKAGIKSISGSLTHQFFLIARARVFICEEIFSVVWYDGIWNLNGFQAQP